MTSHALGVMVLQAGAAEATLHDEDEARAALARVIAAGDASLAELDQLALTMDAGPDIPGPSGLRAAVDDLADRIRAAGMDIDVRFDTEPLDPDIAHAVYRVIQEGITNAAKHAPGGRVEVRVTCGNGLVEVVVTNWAPPDAGLPDPSGRGRPMGSGFGLAGAAERVRTLGGMLSATATPVGGFELRARIPVAADQ